MKKFNGFSLMEMMVVLLIVAIVIAASAPMISKRMIRTAEGGSPWLFTMGGNIFYNGAPDDPNSRTAMIGMRSFPAGFPSHPMLAINATANTDTPALSIFRDDTWIGNLIARENTMGFGRVLTAGNGPQDHSVYLGSINQIRRSGNPAGASVAIGDNVQAQSRSVVIGADAITSGTDSIALGRTATANGQYSIAIGCRSNTTTTNNTQATNTGSIAIGHRASSTGGGSIAIGFAADGSGSPVEATMANSIAIGNVARATGLDAVAIGEGSNASGQDAVAIGTRAHATTTGSIAIGSSNDRLIPGQNAIQIGNTAHAETEHSIAIGQRAQATGNNSIAIGRNVVADGDNTIVIAANPNPTQPVRMNHNNIVQLGTDNDTVFIPGNLVVNGTSVLGWMNGASKSSQNSLYIRESEGNGDIILFGIGTSGDDAVLKPNNSGKNMGKKNVGGFEFTTSASDRRLKNVGEMFAGGLEQVKKLEVYNYTFKKDSANTPRVGVMAQDLLKIFPNAVTKGDDGYLRIRMEDMFYAVVNAVKELDNKITALIEQVKTIADDMSILKNKNAEYEKVITELVEQNKALMKKNAEFEERLTKLEGKAIKKETKEMIKAVKQESKLAKQEEK